ncbi:hypothetical protein CLV28_1735 [Sediminihabitans luteus]|uniref:Uncharacterized protein n=1 Tax=Sediminihabitans luteus TaxID=1138585 RepID=A0A2M9CQX9_9CELL|nr:hypothetical protein [Sediminihabitans luteus]PJJ74241.1 hypothetical protein CLV28_1735 [Sediminihabitans luteus]GII99094.1 hypothetical protein Slu03_14720 [Sediminihabitans luteus]
MSAPTPPEPSAVSDEILREHPEFAEPHMLEDDESVPPRPEEEVADAVRDR